MSFEEVENEHHIHQKPKKEHKCGLREGCEDIDNFRRLNRIHEGVYGIVYRA
jgi:hypothetical protein